MAKLNVEFFWAHFKTVYFTIGTKAKNKSARLLTRTPIYQQ